MQLVLSPESRVHITRIEPDRVRACNADVALACYRVIVGHPRREEQLQRLDLPAWPPVLRFNTAPGYERMPDGTYKDMGEILQIWTPRL